MPDPVRELIANAPLFAGCSGDEIDSIATRATTRSAALDETVCREGDDGGECFVILDGRAKVTISGSPIATLGPGDVFGEASMLDCGPRVATVSALTELHLLVLDASAFAAALESPLLALRLIGTAGVRARANDLRGRRST